MPDVTPSPERFRQADALFDAALDLPRTEHEEFVARACGDDASLLADVRRLLAAFHSSGDFLERPAVEMAAPLLQDTARELAAVPDHLGPYRVVREVGHGGMGAVFLGERDDGQFEQRVALKRVASARGGRALVGRFLEERRILARLEHPRIARLLDGGVDVAGIPWFAMEFIDGERLDTWCDERSLPLASRLSLFASACEAVQYAHQQLVVHRDLKPSNILITTDGQLKLLDFGVAKLLASGDADGHERDDTGTLAMTPQYAAPEQVRGQPVSAATDVYALGVLLYELLTGRRPYELRGRSPGEVERIVCETEPPPPSTTFESSAGAADDLSQRARVRASTPEHLRRVLRGDLDAIVLQALRKEPERRYASAAALLEDLQRYRDHLPVLARPDSAGYRFRKFAGRHRAALGAGTVVAALLVGGFVREHSLRERAEAEARKARAVEEYMVSVFDVADPFAANRASGQEVTARELLERGAARIERELAGQPDAQAELRGALGRVYTNLGLFAQATEHSRNALEQQRALHGERHPDVAEALDRLGFVLTQQNKFDEAEPLLREALAQRQELVGPVTRETATSLDRLGTLMQERGALPVADTMFRRALTVRRQLATTHADSIALTRTLNNLGVLLFVRGVYDEAEPLYREALVVGRAVFGADHPTIAQTLQNLAQVQQLRGKLDESEALYRESLAIKRRVLGDAHPSVTISLNNLANFLIRERDKADEAEPLLREAIALDRKMFGDTHSYVAAGLNNLANAERYRGRFAEAAALGREAVAIAKKVFPGANKETAAYLNGVGNTLLAMDDLDGAAAWIGEALAQYREALGDQHLFTHIVGVNLARVQFERGRAAEAERLYRDAVAVLDSSAAGHRITWNAAQVGIGDVMTARGQASEAVALLERAVVFSTTHAGANHWRTAEANLSLGKALLAAGETRRAEPVLRAAVAILEPQAKAQGRLLAAARRALAASSGDGR